MILFLFLGLYHLICYQAFSLLKRNGEFLQDQMSLQDGIICTSYTKPWYKIKSSTEPSFFFSSFFFCGVVLFCFETGFSHYVVPGWSQIQRAACLGHLNAGFKCMSYYAGFREKEIERKRFSWFHPTKETGEKLCLILKSNTTKTSGDKGKDKHQWKDRKTFFSPEIGFSV